MVKDPHDCECYDDSYEVTDDTNVEIRGFEFFGCFNFKFCQGSINIEFEAQGNKYSRHNNIAQSKHTELFLTGFIKVREDELDRNIKVFGNSNHDVSTIDPEDVIEEECP